MLTRFLNKNNLRKWVVVLIVSLIIFVIPNKIFATDLSLWVDEFSWFDYSKWESFDEDGSNLILNNQFLMSNTIGSLPSFIILRQPLTYENVSIEIKFRYLDESYNYGTGIAVNDTPIPDRVDVAHLKERTIAIWPQTNKRFAVVSSICLSNATNCYSNDFINSKPVMIGGDEFSNWHTVKIKYLNGKYFVDLDGIYSFETKQTERRPNYIWIGNPENITWPVNYSKFLVDYVKVEDLDENEEEFPYLSQKDPQWANQEYDHASDWAPEGHRGIANWGCALTSTAMIFQHFGIKSPSGQTTTPPVLNSWLKNQPDGYVNGGFINWIALTRYAKEAKDAGQSPTSLEFRMSNYDPNQTYETPTILNLPGHFIVGYDQTQDQFKIKDPADETKTELAKNSPTIRKIDRFIPSNTDLSYFMFTIEPDFEIQLKDQNGQSLGEEFTQEPLVDDMGNGSGSNGQGLKILQVPKPPTGDFTLTITNPKDEAQTYHLTEYWYDHNGQVEKKTENYHLIPHHQDKYHFDYTGSVGETNNQISIDSIRQILATYYDQGEMLRFYNHFLNRWLDQVQQANTDQRKQEVMTALKRVVGANTTIITNQARSDILERINQWLSSH